MKKTLLLLILFMVFLTGYTQGTIGTIRPFNVPLFNGESPQMAADTSGIVWFAAGDSLGDSVMVTNEKHTAYYSFANDSFNDNEIFNFGFMADSRNDIWVSFGWRTALLYRVHNSVTQQVHLYVPDSSYSYAHVLLADDHRGKDYFFYQAGNYVLDSLYLVSFDGTSYKTINMASVLLPVDSQAYAAGIFCDYAGNVYITTGSLTYKYDGTNLSISPINFATIVGHVFCTYRNRLLIDNGEQNIYNLSPTGQLSSIYNCGAGNLLGSCLFQNRDSSLWMVNEWGLLKYEGGQFVVKVDPSYLYTNGCNPEDLALFDFAGNIFMSSYCGGRDLVFNLNSSYLIEGAVFNDVNQNGIKDSAEAGIAGLNVAQSPDNIVANTDSAGNYAALFLYPSENSTVSFNCPLYYHVTTPPAYTLTANSDTMCCYNFGIAPNGVIQDLQVNAAADFAVRGYVNYQWLALRNNGTTTVSDTAVYQFDQRYTYVSSFPPADVVQGYTVKWAYSNLVPFEIRNLYVALQLDSTIPAGTVLYDTAVIYPLSSDTTPANNVYALQQTVYSSFDPNHKTVTPSGLINPGDVLTYTVYFQNTGSSPAVNVVINDTLDRNFNFSTFKLLGNSSPVKYQLKGNCIVQFTFSNIQLPDSTSNPSGSIGYVRYSVQIDSNLYFGEDTRNTAYINFDFNAPVATNTTNSFYGVSVVNQITASDNAQVYPNPSAAGWFLSVDQSLVDSPYEIWDMNGRLMYKAEIRQPVSELSVMAAGVYLLRIQGNNGVIVKKMVRF